MANVEVLEEKVPSEDNPTKVHVASKRLPQHPVLDRVDTTTTRIIGSTTVESEEKETPEEEIPQEIPDPDDNYNELLCKECVIRDTVGCDHCGIYIYGFKHKHFKFKVTKLQ
jgi:hypothetical protein